MMKKTCIGGKRDGSSLFSAEKVGRNDDLMREIFLRAPVRSLIRFKLVSKHWSSLISDPEFAQDRTRRLKPTSVVPSGLFFFNSLGNYKKFDSLSLTDFTVQSGDMVPSLSFLFTLRSRPTITILQSCNGLLFFELITRLREYLVCNPTTKSYKILPQHCFDSQEIALGFTLVFDPSISMYYKVVAFAPSKIFIYSSETGIWSTSTPPSYQRHYNLAKCDFTYRFYWNGLICCWNSGSFYNHFFEYDLKEDSYKEVDLPPNPYGYDDQTLRYFGESQGRLHLVYVETFSLNTLKVFERDRDTLNWSLMYLVHIDTLQSKIPEICVKWRKTTRSDVFSVLSVLVGEKEEDFALVLCVQGMVASYNVHDETLEVLSVLETEHIRLRSAQIDISRSNCCDGFNFIKGSSEVEGCRCFNVIESLTQYDCCRGFNFIESLAAV